MIEEMSNPQFRNFLRKVYWVETQIAKKKNDARIDPYCICDWRNIFTPIERNVWHDIRKIGTSMWPQYPILNYFVDFADPLEKIIIEVDSKEWHKDKEKDNKRQRDIEKYGWKFYRIEGWRTFYDFDNCYNDCNWEDEEDTERCDYKYFQSSEFIIKDIKEKFYHSSTTKIINKEIIDVKLTEDITRERIQSWEEQYKFKNKLINYYEKFKPVITF